MIEFKPFNHADDTLIKWCEQLCVQRPAIASIACMALFYPVHWAVVSNFLVLRFQYDAKGRIAYLQPIGEEDFSHIIPLLIEDVRSIDNQPLRLYALDEAGSRILKEYNDVYFAYSRCILSCGVEGRLKELASCKISNYSTQEYIQAIFESTLSHKSFNDRAENIVVAPSERLYHSPQFMCHSSMMAMCMDAQAIACKALWQEVFGDDETFIDDFLVRYYAADNMLYIEEDKHLLSMLHLVPMRCNGIEIGYVYAVATRSDMRGRGLATRLLQEARKRAEAVGMAALVLIPAGDDARQLYERVGYTGCYPVQFQVYDDFDFGTGDIAQDKAMIMAIDASFDIDMPLILRPY